MATLRMVFSDGRIALFGLGPETFLFAIEPFLEEHGIQLLFEFDNPHNLLLGCLASSGVPAALLYLWLNLLLLNRCRRGGKAMLPIGAALLLYQLHGMFIFSCVIVSPMAWCLSGLAAGACISTDRY